jgi:hypothetical protein
MEHSNDIENVKKKILDLFEDPICKILLNKSFFTEIQLEILLLDYLTYGITEPKVTQFSKALARQISKGRTRGSYNRVLHQSRNKLEYTLYSILLLGYLGILGDIRISTFIETSEKMQEYLKLRYSLLLDDKTSLDSNIKPAKRLELETALRKQLYQLISKPES